MKIQISILICLTLVELVASRSHFPNDKWIYSTDDEQLIQNAFDEFVEKFDRQYGDERERAFRFGLFRANFKRVQQMNARALNSGAAEAVWTPISAFADKSDEEQAKNFGFHATLAGDGPQDRSLLFSAAVPIEEIPVPSDLPQHFDWRDRHMVTEVRNQKHCGSCWAFGTAEAVESALLIADRVKNVSNFALSVQELVLCVDPTFYYGCTGLDPRDWDNLEPMKYIAQHGLLSESELPYEPEKLQDTEHKLKCPIGPKQKVNAQMFAGFRYQRLPNNASQLQAWLYKHGPFAVVVDAQNWRSFKAGTSENPNILAADSGYVCRGTTHAVLVVGYGMHDGKPYWIVKDSGGVGFGIDGYIWHARGTNYCFIEQHAVGVYFEKESDQ